MTDSQTKRSAGKRIVETHRPTDRLKDRQTDKKVGAPDRHAAVSRPSLNGRLMECKHMFPRLDFP